MTNEAKKETEQENHSHNFETDVSRLLDIVANALYSNRDVFLRELVSNAADACDRLRYDALQNSALIKDSQDFQIQISADNNDLILRLNDNGIGMSKEELIENLGTIARSGTAAILDNLKNQGNEKDMSLIGQFGVGFYASFMVANKVEVVSRKAGSDHIWIWSSDGRTGFNIEKANDDEKARLFDNHGTAITLYMKPDAIDYLLDDKIKQIIATYSDHIEIPIYLNAKNPAASNDENNDEGNAPINTASALWTRSKSDITQEQYKEFYHHIGHVFDDPIMTLHWTAEGVIEYTSLLYIPSMRPWDLYDPERKNALRLYVKKVFISDELESLLYPWLRFVRGIVDTQDLPLNISREMLQSNPVVHKIRNGLTKKVLNEIDKLSRDDEAAFLTLWGQFGAIIKEGLYDAIEHREAIFKICRFASTHNTETPTSLTDYIYRMKDGQDTIYYMSGEKIDALRNSPQIEGFKSRGVEVLFLTDTVDEFWLQQINQYKDFKFQSITQGSIDLDKFDSEKAENADEDKKDTEAENQKLSNFKDYLHEKLAGHIEFVRLSKRLTDSPVCLVSSEKGADMHMEKVLKLHQKYEPDTKPILEINPNHNLILSLAKMVDGKKEEQLLEDAALLLLDQALIIQGETPNDPAAFARRMANVMEKGLV